ncbi:MAG: NUDIX hydrolase [SAR202 cluster bacterium]|jgi:ADP-ribose pyrophosphatase|nr:NUDIX hydrolase [SAR202 cluster bacterium]MDP6513358.1 NUDIX hydrolase [SAR202 cluster bacterium]MDP6715733.1 NUDIX hydrolase [SAR202 cluster bacterium]
MTQKPELISQKSIFDGHIVKVKVDTLALANGNRVEREIVEKSNAVVMVPIDNDDNVLLVRQWRHPADQALLEAPAGTVEGDESADDCAQRELQEEIGYASRNLRTLGGFWTTPGFCDEFMYVYLARDLVESKLPEDDDEEIQVERIPLSRIPQLIRLGEIIDAKTIAALLMSIHLFS